MFKNCVWCFHLICSGVKAFLVYFFNFILLYHIINHCQASTYHFKLEKVIDFITILINIYISERGRNQSFLQFLRCSKNIQNHHYCYKYIYLTMVFVLYFLKHKLKACISEVGQMDFCYNGSLC